MCFVHLHNKTNNKDPAKLVYNFLSLPASITCVHDINTSWVLQMANWLFKGGLLIGILVKLSIIVSLAF